MYSFYGYLEDACCSSHCTRDISNLTFSLCIKRHGTINVSTVGLVFISIFNYFLPTWNKGNNNNNNDNNNNNNNNNSDNK